MRRALLALLALLAATAAHAQSGPSVIVGRVTSQGKPLANAVVQIDSDAIQNIRRTETTSRGTYWSALLPPGTYHITFSHAGTQTVTRNAEVRIGETVRVDAELAPSTEGEEVTMTKITRSIAERPDLVSSLDTSVIEELPVARELSARMALAPGVYGRTIRGSSENLFVVDGMFQRHRGANVEVEDAIADASVVETATPGQFGRFSGGVVLAATRSGGNDLSASVRTIVTHGNNDVAEGSDGRAEVTVGGRLVRDALWFFLAGQSGSDASFGAERSGLAKLTASPFSRATLSGSIVRSDDPDESRAGGDAMLIVSRRALLDAHADTSRVDGSRDHHESLSVHSLVPTRFGDHAFVAGGEEFGNTLAAFAGDTWSHGERWVLSASARWDENRGVSPRAGAAYDLHGDGTARVSVTYARYAGDGDAAREETLAYTQRVLTSGFARVALVRRMYASGRAYRALEGETRADYLFLTLGASASLGQQEQEGVAWVTATAPGIEQHFTLALLERYRRGTATDVSLLYRFSRPRVEPFAKIEVLNVFDRTLPPGEDALGSRRGFRLSVGARL